MARGYPGAFGRKVNALYIWLPMCGMFLLPFLPNYIRDLGVSHVQGYIYSKAVHRSEIGRRLEIGWEIPIGEKPATSYLVRIVR